MSSVSKPSFLWSGMTMACFWQSVRRPWINDALTRTLRMMWGHQHTLYRKGWHRISEHDFAGDDMMMWRTSLTVNWSEHWEGRRYCVLIDRRYSRVCQPGCPRPYGRFSMQSRWLSDRWFQWHLRFLSSIVDIVADHLTRYCDEVRSSVHFNCSLVNSTTLLAVRANPWFALEFRLSSLLRLTLLEHCSNSYRPRHFSR